MNERDAGEAAAVADSMGNSTEGGNNDVTEGLAHVEALVAVLPRAVNAVGRIRFSEQVFPGHLEQDIWALQYVQTWNTNDT